MVCKVDLNVASDQLVQNEKKTWQKPKLEKLSGFAEARNGGIIGPDGFSTLTS